MSASGSETSTMGGGSRWCPTPEQVMLLEGMYRGGLKTPTAVQIQQITARLSIYGKVQGKNVFYWFQNHKARDRQKLRKKLMAMYQNQHLYLPCASAHEHDHHPFLLHHQIGGVEDGSRRMMNKWSMDFPPEETYKGMCDCPLMTMMMMDHMNTTPYYTTRAPPPKTLQLFPITTSTSLKDDHCSISKP